MTAVGRDPESAVFLDDITVSRKHAEFERRDGDGWFVQRRRQPQRHVRERRAGRRDQARVRRRGPDRQVQVDVLRGRGVRSRWRARATTSRSARSSSSVKTEFPDITISKIRFLEAEGLIEPERTPSGYRKFYVDDVDRLKSILRMQRDEYLPLKVIKERLLTQDAADGEEGLEERSSTPTVDDDAEAASRRGDRRGPHRPADVASRRCRRPPGSTATASRSSSRFGIVCSHGPDGAQYYDGDDYIILSIVKDFFRFGIEPRHLTMYKHFAEREADRSSRRWWRPRCGRRTPTRGRRPPRRSPTCRSPRASSSRRCSARTLRDHLPERVSRRAPDAARSPRSSWSSLIASGRRSSPGWPPPVPPVRRRRRCRRTGPLRRSPVAPRRRRTRPPPRTRVPRAALLADLDTGQVLFAKAPRPAGPIASLTKIMTALADARAHRRWTTSSRSRPRRVFGPRRLRGLLDARAARGGAAHRPRPALRAPARLRERRRGRARRSTVAGIGGRVRRPDERARAATLGMRQHACSSPPTGSTTEGTRPPATSLRLTRAAYDTPGFAPDRRHAVRTRSRRRHGEPRADPEPQRAAVALPGRDRRQDRVRRPARATASSRGGSATAVGWSRSCSGRRMRPSPTPRRC